MARGSQQSKITDITEAKASRLMREGESGDTLFCKRIPGFYLMKQTRRCAWRWRYTDDEGSRRTATIGNFPGLLPVEAAKVALEWVERDARPLEEKQQRQQSRQQAVQDADRRTLRYYLDNGYSRVMERWKPDAAKTNYQRIAGHFVDLLDRDMTTFTAQDIRDWQYRIEAKGRTYSTVKRVYSSLKTLLLQAVKDGVLEADPLHGFTLDPPRIEEQQRIADDPVKADRRMLTSDEIRAIHAGLEALAEETRAQRRNSRAHGKPHLEDLDQVALPHWFIPFAHLAMHTGLRPGDLYALTWQDLNIPFGRLTKATEKSKNAIRRGKKPAIVDVKLNPTIKGIMETWWQQQGRPDSGLVFPSSRIDGAMDKKAHVKPWRRVKRLGGVAPDLDFYALRHHFISSLVRAGMPLLAVARLAGHKSVAMIEAHYGHLCEAQAAEALDIVAATIEAGQAGRAAG